HTLTISTPPLPTPFPYTTLFRSRLQFDARLTASSSFKEPMPPIPVQITGVGFLDKLLRQRGLAPNGIELHPVLDIQFDPAPGPRSEEHTSELQSRFDLVCRLLLE